MSDEETNVQAIVEEQTTDEQAAAEQAAAEQAAAEQAAAEQAAAEQAAAEQAAAEQAAAEQAAAEQAAAEQAAAEQAAAEQAADVDGVEDEASYFKKVLTGEIEMTEKDEEKIYSKVGGVRQKIIDNIYNKDEKRKVLLVYLKNIKFR